MLISVSSFWVRVWYKNCTLQFTKCFYIWYSSFVFGVTTDYQVQEPIQGSPSPFRVWTPEVVLETTQVNKENSPGPAQVQNCHAFGWEGLLSTLMLSFTLKRRKHPSPTSDQMVGRITTPLEVANYWHKGEFSQGSRLGSEDGESLAALWELMVLCGGRDSAAMF